MTEVKPLVEYAAEELLRQYAAKRPLEAAQVLRNVIQKLPVQGCPLEDDDIIEIRFHDQTQTPDMLKPHRSLSGAVHYYLVEGKYHPWDYGPFRILAKHLKQPREVLDALATVNPVLCCSLTFRNLTDPMMEKMESDPGYGDFYNGWKEVVPDGQDGEYVPGTDVAFDDLDGLTGAYEQIAVDWNVKLPMYNGLPREEEDEEDSAPFEIVGMDNAILREVLPPESDVAASVLRPDFARYVRYMNDIHKLNEKTYSQLEMWVLSALSPNRTDIKVVEEAAKFLVPRRSFNPQAEWPEELRGAPRMCIQLFSRAQTYMRTKSHRQVTLDWNGEVVPQSPGSPGSSGYD